MTTPQLTDRLRGGGCGVLVGALAVAAHGLGGGAVPRSAEVALLLLVSLVAGLFAGGSTRALPTPARPAAALLAGQWAGHFALTGTLDHHGGGLAVLHLPSAPMVTAHLLAAFACAALILGAERLYLIASGTLRALLRRGSAQVRGTVRARTEVAGAGGRRPKGVRRPRAPPLFA
ncbi:hypothetical protein [Nocardia asteroides]|uniref:hypothetical protein n=1 Tax=Nocardia asteroides TaxID=1824 RepID=UPI0033F9C997